MKTAHTDKTLQIDSGALVYGETITDAEALEVRDFFLRYGGFKEPMVPFHLCKIDGIYRFNVFMGDQLPAKQEFLPIMQALADALSAEVFGDAVTDVCLYKKNFEELWSVRSR